MQIFIFHFVACFILLSVNAKIDCEHKLQQCENKKPLPHKPICGNDNLTYTHRCFLLKAQCTRNPQLKIKYKGECRDRQICWQDRNKKLDENKNNTNGQAYIPQCLNDGSYAPIQCHKWIGYCWCVTSDGKMVPRTTARHRKIECQIRTSRNTQLKNAIEVGNFTTEGCDETDKNTFINNLVRIFKTEYNRGVLSKLGSSLYPSSNSLEEEAIQWKFSSLDTNNNKALNKSEYRELRNLVKKVVSPRKCAKIFIHLCDTDRNSILSYDEWISCLNVALKNEPHERTIQPEQQEASAGDFDIELEDVQVVEQNNDSLPSLTRFGTLPLKDHSLMEDKDEAENKVNDCFSDRKAALDEVEVGNQEMYVPECASDGRYKRIQCYHSTGYCWCVLEESGKPIPGTSVKDAVPTCDSSQHISRQMKGCLEPKKAIFIKNLLEFFHQNLTVPKQENSQQDVYGEKEYQSAIFGFQRFDTNKNDLLDRKEWKAFRFMMSTNKTMKRCGQKFPRYCDSNRDDRITKMEWFQCLNLTTSTLSVTNSAAQNLSNSNRRGPNPVESYLKDD